MESVKKVQDSKEYVFKGPHPRRLTAEQILDSIHHNLGLDYHMTADEYQRIAKLVKRSQNHSKSLEKANPSEPRVIHSEIVEHSTSRRFSVDVDGEDNLLFAAMPIDKNHNKLALLKEKHRSVRKKESALERLDKTTIVNLTQSPKDEQLDENPLPHVYWRSNIFLPSNSTILDLTEEKPIEDLSLIKLKGAGAVYLKLKKSKSQKIDFEVSVDPYEEVLRYRFLIIKDFKPRFAFKENSYLQTILGRPSREQITTERDSSSATSQILTLTSGKDFYELLRKASKSLGQQKVSYRKLVNHLYLNILSREPTEDEMEMSVQMLEDPKQEILLEDFLWTLIMHPEFQFLN